MAVCRRSVVRVLVVFTASASFVAVAFATVDQDWLVQGAPLPAVPPQSHVINARTNPNWRKQNENFVVQGRTYFVSKARETERGCRVPLACSKFILHIRSRWRLFVPCVHVAQPIFVTVTARRTCEEVLPSHSVSPPPKSAQDAQDAQGEQDTTPVSPTPSAASSQSAAALSHSPSVSAVASVTASAPPSIGVKPDDSVDALLPPSASAAPVPVPSQSTSTSTSTSTPAVGESSLGTPDLDADTIDGNLGGETLANKVVTDEDISGILLYSAIAGCSLIVVRARI